MIVRPVIVALAVLLLAIQIVRTTDIEGLGGGEASLWIHHPRNELRVAGGEVERAAREGRPPPSSAVALLSDAAAKEPLAAGPYLVRGVQAELAGDGERARQAFEAAQWRDPRSLRAASFLAERYFRTGQTRRGLEEVWALARLDPAGPQSAAYYVAAYAKDPRTLPVLRQSFSKNIRGSDVRLLAFEPRSVSPFDWSLHSSRIGLAEPRAGDRLHVIYYGHEDGFLASRLLLLAPGAYLLSMELRGEPLRPKALSWSLWCDEEGEALASSTLEAVADHGLAFTVPASCPAQWLRLGASSSQTPQNSEMTIASLRLAKARPRA